jgi:hypothetical protein
LFLATIPDIGRATVRFRLLGTIVVVGGFSRLLGVALHGVPDKSMLFGLAMELGATPALLVWQAKAAGRAHSRRR